MTFPKRILLVDNEPRVTRLVRRALEATGNYVIEAAAGSAVALKAARWFRPDMILLDTAFEGNSGGLALQIRKDSWLQNTPVVLLCGSACDDELVSSGELGGYSFTALPVKISEIVGYIDEMLANEDVPCPVKAA